MHPYEAFPEKPIAGTGPIRAQFLARGIRSFREACRFVHELPYGYNSDRDDILILFKEEKGTCTTKHAVIGTLAQELGLPIRKHVGIYAMTEAIVTGTGRILSEYGLPYVPMLHCFLVYATAVVDLTEGNLNGKNQPLREFLYEERVAPDISAKDEYLLYRRALNEVILKRPELEGVDIKRILQAREAGLKLLKARIGQGEH
jgi:hypothetical protein